MNPKCPLKSPSTINFSFSEYRNDGSKNTSRISLKTDSSDNSTTSRATHALSTSELRKIHQFQPASANNGDPSCILHENSNHSTDDCRKFIKMAHKDKITLHKRCGLCFACMGKHLRSNCNLTTKCSICNGNHVTSMHFEPRSENAPAPESSLYTTQCGTKHSAKSCSKTILVDLAIKGNPEKTMRCYAIIDEQSSSSFWTQPWLNLRYIWT